MDTKLDWEELVDLYVDGECTEEERKLVERKAETDASVREAIEAARRIGQGLAALRVAVPDELDARIQRALIEQGNAQAYVIKAGDDYVRPALTAKAFFNYRFVGTCAAALVAVLGVVSGMSLRTNPTSHESSAWNDEVNAVAVDERAAIQDEPFIFIPSPAGDAPESVSKRDSQDALWTVVNLNESEDMKKQLREFQRLCGNLDIKFTKSGVDGEYSLSDVTVEQWNQISESLEKVGGADESDGLKNWREAEKSESKAVRVVFRADSAKAEQTNLEQTSEE